MARARRTYQHVFIFVAPINYEILRAGHSVVAFLYFVYFLHLITPVAFSFNQELFFPRLKILFLTVKFGLNLLKKFKIKQGLRLFPECTIPEYNNSDMTLSQCIYPKKCIYPDLFGTSQPRP